MGAIRQPQPVKLIVAMLAGSDQLLAQAVGRLVEELGPVDQSSPAAEFTSTHYYDQEMGSPLLRQFVAFERLIDPGRLGPIKRLTNQIEEDLATPKPDAGETRASAPRRVNLDPGYVAEGKLVLASTKDFSHRVHLGEGIYAEVTLMYGKGRWIAQKYTFPDYASGAYDDFLTAAREQLRRQLGKEGRT
jgi:hypothetical protein